MGHLLHWLKQENNGKLSKHDKWMFYKGSDNPMQEVIAHTKPVGDAALNHLVSVANVGAGLSLTLVVDGQVIFGDLISGTDYCDEMYNSFANNNSDQALGEAVGHFFLELKARFYEKENHTDIPTNFIHLKNVAYLKADGEQLTVSGSILRVMLDKVSAFAVGRPE